MTIIPISVQGATPFAATQSATLITFTNATLNGMATPNGEATWAWFEWSEGNNSFGHATEIVDTGSGMSVVPLKAQIDGLTPGRVVHCRLVVSNLTGVAVGGTRSFITGGRITAWGTSPANAVGQTNVPGNLTNAVSIAAAYYHSVALRADGKIVAWGSNVFGQTNVPTAFTNVSEIAANGYFSMALRSNGTVVAWGRNDFGQTNVPTGLSNIVAIACGAYHGLALRSNGTVIAWGRNNVSQTNVPSGLSNVVAIAGGSYHSLALRNDGTVVAWGTEEYGTTNVPAGLSNVIAIAAGYFQNLALRNDGTVMAWGSNVYGATNVPPGLTNVAIAKAGGDTGVAVREDGTLSIWGDGQYGQLNMPVELTHAVDVSVGAFHGMALTEANVAPYTFSQVIDRPGNADAVIQLSGGALYQSPLGFRITAIPGAGTLYQYAAGVRGAEIEAGAVVSDPSGRVIFAPGFNEGGSPYANFNFVAESAGLVSELATVRINAGVPAVATQPATEISEISAKLNGMVIPNGLPSRGWFEWGTNRNLGQLTSTMELGTAASIDRVSSVIQDLNKGQMVYFELVISNAAGVKRGATQQFMIGGSYLGTWGGGPFTPLGLAPDITAVAGGVEHVIALKADGTIISWGTNTFGQTNVPAMTGRCVALAAGDYHNLALQEDGKVVAWGRNTLGATNVPPGLSNIVAVSGGNNFSVGLRSDGTLVRWGSTAIGPVPAVSNVVAISSGRAHNLALTINGQVIGWGESAYGQSDVPSTLSNVIAIACGSLHSLALRNDGTVVAWGNNSKGQTNIPAGLSNVVAIAAGVDDCLALRKDGSVVAWGNPGTSPTPPSSLRNPFVIAASRGVQNMAISANLPPQTFDQAIVGLVNRDVVLQLGSSDPEGDPVTFRIIGKPLNGTLYQNVNNARGTLLGADTVVSNAVGSIIFAPALNKSGDPLTSFTYVANDGLSDSAPATVTARVFLPSAPQFTSWKRLPNWTFEMEFTGESNATYRVLTSPDLVNWTELGKAVSVSPGTFRFTNMTSNASKRFYRAVAP